MNLQKYINYLELSHHKDNQIINLLASPNINDVLGFYLYLV